MNTDKKIELNLTDEAIRLSELTGISYDETYAYVLAEDEFFDLKGFNDYGDGNFKEPENNVIDVPEMLEYISCKTGLEMHKCEKLDEAEMEYFSELGIV